MAQGADHNSNSKMGQGVVVVVVLVVAVIVVIIIVVIIIIIILPVCLCVISVFFVLEKKFCLYLVYLCYLGITQRRNEQVDYHYVPVYFHDQLAFRALGYI